MRNNVVRGNIDTEKINQVHRNIYELVNKMNDASLKVESITEEILDNWVGYGRNEFESTYTLLKKKLSDYQGVLDSLYECLVESEAGYEEVDSNYRKELDKAKEKSNE